MGVPGLFSLLRRRYPQICRATDKRRDLVGGGNEVDNLYVDMNHIIHSCTHAHVAKDRSQPLTEAEMFAGMAAYLEALLDLLEPRRVVLIAVDGVAPRAKMNQQRTRRFLSAYISGITDRIEAEVRREMISEAGGSLDIPQVKRFDSNIITPGTDFMLLLARWLREWCEEKARNDKRFRHTAFIISDASEPGEGEHKIMKFVRHLRCQPGYDPNTRHVVYGQDADLLLLTLVCHEPHFKVMREDNDAQTATAAKAKEARGQEQQQQQQPLSAVAAALQGPQAVVAPVTPTQASADHLHMPHFETVDIAVLRECLQWEFQDLVGPPGPPDSDQSAGPDSGSESDDELSDNGLQASSSSSNALESAAKHDSMAAVVTDGMEPLADQPAVLLVDHLAGAGAAAVAAGGTAGAASSSHGAEVNSLQPAAVAADSSDELSELLHGLAVDSPAAATGASPAVAADAVSLQVEVPATVGGGMTIAAPVPVAVPPSVAAAQAMETSAGARPAASGIASLVAAAPSVQQVSQQLAAHSPTSTTAASATACTATATSGDPDLKVSTSHLLAVASVTAPDTPAAAAPPNRPGKQQQQQQQPPCTATKAAGKPDRQLIRGSSGSSDGSSSAEGAGAGAAAAARPPKHRGLRGLSFECLLDDLVVLSFLAGNDFLPNVPSIDMYDKPCGVDLLFSAYKALLPKMGGHISSGGNVNRGRLVQLLVFLARDEEAAYKRRAECRRRRAQQQRDEQAAAEESFWSLFDGGLSMGELPPGIDIDKLLAGQAPEVAEALGLNSAAFVGARPAAVDLNSLTPGELCAELSNRVAVRVKDRMMAGDPWAQDPIGMDLPGYRQRYYQARFPELFDQFDGDIDKVAARVAADFVDGVSWVLRYYTCGPAALDWLQHQHQHRHGAADQQGAGNNDDDDMAALLALTGVDQAASRPPSVAAGSKGGKSRLQAGRSSGDASGCSWSWCYPHHYAPLMQDLSKVKLAARAGGSSKGPITIEQVSLHRGLDDPAACHLEEWAPVGGPVRPLLQLMCVLPAKSVSDALPAPLANVIVLAESMDLDADTSCRAQLRRHQQHQQQQQLRSKQGRKAARRAKRAAAAAKVDGLSGLDVLAALGEATSVLSSDDDDDDHHHHQQDDEGGEEQTEETEGTEESAGGEAAALAGFELSGDVDVDLMRLAQELCEAFPADVEQLVDLTGKRWLHTGIVRLPMALPLQVAAVLQAVLVLQQQGRLSAAEQLRNTFRPAIVVTTTAAAKSAGAEALSDALQSPVATSSSAGEAAALQDTKVWRLFTSTVAEGADSTSNSQRDDTRASAAADVPAASLGALGLMLSQRRALHTIPSSTLQQLSHQQARAQPQVPVWEGQLDVAGLPVPQHSCSLVPGAEPPPLSMSTSTWRHVRAGFSAAVGYADKVLGIRSADSDSTGGRGGGRGRHGWDGSRAGRGSRGGGRDSRGGGAGRAGRSFLQQHQQDFTGSRYQQQQQQQQQPYLDPAYYYQGSEDYYYQATSSNYQPAYSQSYSSRGGRGAGSRGGATGGRSGRASAPFSDGRGSTRYQY